MKKLYIVLTLLILVHTLVQATTITAVTDMGQWTTNGTWNLNRRPANNDTVVIPANITVRFRSTQNLNKIVLKIYGTLLINEGDLKLSANSVIYVYPGGQIRGQAAGIIEIGSTKKFDYSNPPVNGPMYANSSTGGEPNGFQSFSVLPVTFLNFSVSKKNNSVNLTWTTADEQYNQHFEIERSVNSVHWISIGKVIAAENPGSVNHYMYNDKSVSGSEVYYRIKQVDIDGKFMYSQIRKVADASYSDYVRIHSSGQKISIELTEPAKGIVMRLASLNGQVLYTCTLKESSLKYHINLPSTSKGIYVLQVIKNGCSSAARKIIL